MAFVTGVSVGLRGPVRNGCPNGRRSLLSAPKSKRCALRMQSDEAEDEAPSDSAIPTSVEADVPEEIGKGRKEMVTQLLELCAVTNRGQNASAEQKSIVEDIVAALEADNPNPSPVETDLIDGTWNLIYLSAPFYKSNPLLAPTASPVLDVGQIRQIISMETGELISEVDITAFPMITGTVVTSTRITPVGSERLELVLEKATLKGGSAFERFDLGGLKVDIPVEEIYSRIRGSLPEAFIDTYYVTHWRGSLLEVKEDNFGSETRGWVVDLPDWHTKEMTPCFVGSITCGPGKRERTTKCSFKIAEISAAVALAGTLAVTPMTPMVVHAAGDVQNYDHDQSLVGADFTDATNLVGAIFTKANCQSAAFVNADLTNANVEDANFSDADMSGAKMGNAFAPKAKFTRAKLINTYLEGANLIGAKFDGTDITGADFTDALLDPATIKRLCLRAKGTNPITQVTTAESLNCPE